MSRKRLLKALVSVALALTSFHLWVSLDRLAPSMSEDDSVPRNAALVSDHASHPELGTDEETLIEFATVDSLIDSLLIHGYDLRPAWIKTGRVQTERALYERKIVQIPRNFAVTLFNLDLKNLLEPAGWSVMAVRERMSRLPGALDVFVDVGREHTVFAQLHLLVSASLPTRGKEVALVVSGFGLSYDELTKAFIELPETITLLVPTGQQHSKITAHEARRAGKTLLSHLPATRNILYLDDSPDEFRMRQQLYDVLSRIPDGGLIVAYEKIHTYNVLKAELPRLAKKGYRLIPYGR